MLNTLTFGFINRLLQDDPWAAQSLANFAGAHVTLQLEHRFKIVGKIEASGLLTPVTLTDGQEPTLSIDLPPHTPRLWVEGGLRACVKTAKIRGNIDLANTLNSVMDNIRPDPEAFMAARIGDIAAQRTVSLFRQLQSHVTDLSARLNAQFSEHVSEGHSVIVPPQDLHQFSHAVHTLRDDVARLEQRVRRLQA